MSKATVFAALLKHWRGARGMSQLDLASAADVSTRHISFIETGRSRPSREMVLRLAATLDVPLREQNALLHAAGFSPQFADDVADLLEDSAVGEALRRIMDKQEPYPLTVFDRHYRMVRMNRSATRLLGMLGVDPASTPNLMELMFDPEGARPYIVDWERAARFMVARIQRELLHRPGDEALHLLLSRLLAYEGVPQSWRDSDFDIPSEPALSVRFEKDGLKLGFFTTLTVFQAPQNAALEELHIESYFPLDEVTEQVCLQLAQT